MGEEKFVIAVYFCRNPLLYRVSQALIGKRLSGLKGTDSFRKVNIVQVLNSIFHPKSERLYRQIV